MTLTSANLYDWQIAAIRAGIADADAGWVVDHEPVAAWLESWGTENELPAPRCDRDGRKQRLTSSGHG